MAEETGLVVAPGALVGRCAAGRTLIADYRCTVVGGTLRAGDDAADARFVRRRRAGEPAAGPPAVDTLREWDALPR